MQIRYETMKLARYRTKQVRPGDSAVISQALEASVFVSAPDLCNDPWHPLRYLERERTEGRKREKFYICLDVTHTPGQSRVNPERQEEEKSGHTTGRRPKQAQGGRGTDGPPEPTYTAKRT